MIRFAADEDLDNHIVRALRRRLVDVDLVTVQEAGRAGTIDRDVLMWAGTDGRVLLSHDASTMTAAAYARLERGEVMPGVIIIPQSLSIGQAVEELLLVASLSTREDWDGQVRFLPIR
jgi:hypothetical protein